MARLAAFYFAYFFALGAFSPYFSPYLEARGLDPGQISVVMSLWYGSRVLAPPLWALGCERIGPAQAWLRAGCALTLALFALFLLPLPYVALLLVMAGFASFYNAVMPQFESITLERLGPRRDAYARIRLWGSVGFLLANLAYGRLLLELGYQSLALLLLPAFALLLLAALANPVADLPRAMPRQASAGVPAGVLSGRTWTLLAIAFLMQVAHGPLYVYLALYLDQYGWSAQQIGAAWALGVVAEVAMFWFMPQLLRRLDARWLIAACLLAGALRWWLLARWPQHAGLVYGGQLLHALTFGAFHASLMQLISAGHSGLALNRVQAWLYGFGSGGGGVAGSLLAGWIWLHVGHGQTFLLAAAISLLALPLLLLLRAAPPAAIVEERHAT